MVIQSKEMKEMILLEELSIKFLYSVENRYIKDIYKLYVSLS